MRFVLDTDAVSSAASAISKVSSNVSSIACNKYKIDDASSDGIDFSGARSTLAANISACTDRIKATGTIINEIVNQHTQLQQKLTFENYLNPPVEEEDSISNDAGSPRSGRTYGSPRGNYDYDSPYTNAIATSVTKELPTGLATGLAEGLLTTGISESLKKIRSFDVNSLAYANVDFNKLTDPSKKVMDATSKAENGYLMVNGRYVIACPPGVGNVGDVVRFQSKDGKIVECVVGVNTVTAENNKKVFLLIDDNQKAKAVDFGKLITDKGTTVTTIGTYTDSNLENQTNIDKDIQTTIDAQSETTTESTPSTTEVKDTTETTETPSSTEKTDTTETTENLLNEGDGTYV